MKNTFLATALLVLPFLAISQIQKSINPVNQSTNHPSSATAMAGKQSTNHQTRAVVIGISDYQDPAIPDLRFADRDAVAFADWLRSPAGGTLPESSIHLLLNKDATTGKIIAALDGLISASKPGDVAILYFSGHGDVERVTKFQRGYFLTWDSPPAVYAAGAFSLVFLQDIISTLSETGVQVVVVSDACRAGKLAGSEFGGAQATSAAMAKQFANEIKILSCQPDEFSLEGEQWGGGRGAFSYHLVDGLYGLADGNSDGTVSLLELGRYLEDKVPGETAPHSQIPFTVGSKAARVASVDAGMLASWREKKEGQPITFAKIEGRGLEDLALAKADSSIREMYAEFTAAMERSDLMPTDSTAGKSANDYYEILIKEPALADLHGLMTRNFAAALMDEGQQFINLLLKSDPQVLEYMYLKGRIDFSSIHLKLKRAAELLGPKHYVYNILKAKEYYFKAGTYPVEYFPGIAKDSVSNIQKQTWLNGLNYDEEAPYLICRLLAFYDLDSFKIMVNRLEELAPKWAMGFDDIAFGYLSRGEDTLSIEYYLKAIATDSLFYPSYSWIGVAYTWIGKDSEAKKWWTLHIQKVMERFASQSDAKQYIYEYHDLIRSMLYLNRFDEAEMVLNKLIAADSTEPPLSWIWVGWDLFEHGKFREMEQVFSRLTQKGPSLSVIGWNGLGWALLRQKRHDEAELAFKNCVVLDSTQVACWNGLGQLNQLQSRYNEAAQAYGKVVELNPNYFGGYISLAYLSAETFAKAGSSASNQAKTEALAYVEQAIQKKATFEQLENDEDLAPLRALPEWKELMKKHFPDQVKD